MWRLSTAKLLKIYLWRFPTRQVAGDCRSVVSELAFSHRRPLLGKVIVKTKQRSKDCEPLEVKTELQAQSFTLPHRLSRSSEWRAQRGPDTLFPLPRRDLIAQSLQGERHPGKPTPARRRSTLTVLAGQTILARALSAVFRLEFSNDKRLIGGKRPAAGDTPPW